MKSVLTNLDFYPFLPFLVSQQTLEGLNFVLTSPRGHGLRLPLEFSLTCFYISTAESICPYDK